jgi:hypothetical protein
VRWTAAISWNESGTTHRDPHSLSRVLVDPLRVDCSLARTEQLDGDMAEFDAEGDPLLLRDALGG